MEKMTYSSTHVTHFNKSLGENRGVGVGMCLSVRFSPSSEEPGVGGRMQVTGAAVPMG